MNNNKQRKVKEPVRLRTRKLADGSQSIYLDIYKDGVRSYEFLNLYIIPEVTRADKIKNEETLTAANAIKSLRIIDISNNKAGLTLRTSKSKITLQDYMQVFLQKKIREQKSEARITFIKCAMVVLDHYIEEKGLKGIRIGNIDLAFCEGFEDYLRTARDTRYKLPTAKERKKGVEPKKIAEGTAYGYFAVLNIALAWAVKHDFLKANPIDKMDITLKQNYNEKPFLTIDEVKVLLKAPCKNEELKRAFLFSCFSGFRISDIMALKWSDLIKDGEILTASIIMKKTKKRINQPIDQAAMAWLPERGEALDTDKVFKLNTLATIEKQLHAWIKDTTIDKHVTFHTARHTYGTMLVSQGADLYTISQLMGHADTRMTQIYAKVLDTKKKEAASLLNDIVVGTGKTQEVESI